MKNNLLSSSAIRHIHFMGIGGIGVRGLAEILLKQGYTVSGCDTQDNPGTQRLTKLGAHIEKGHNSAHIDQNADALIYSSAIAADHPELTTAQQRAIPCLRRGELLGELMQAASMGIAIAGTHGKTTTTGLVNHLLTAANLDPTCVNGGIVQGGDSTVQVGQGQYFIAEADESDASFMVLNPQIAVVTNIEADHLSAYAGDFNCLKQTFADFLNKLPPEGVAICCSDDPSLCALLPNIPARVITYGFNDSADIRVVNFQQTGTQCQFDWLIKGDSHKKSAMLNLPGKHNVSNALAAIAVAHVLNISDDVISQALPGFPGMGRRFHSYGELNLSRGKALLFDDYGHHPTEIRATLNAARQAWPSKRVVLAFQPHRYSRTKELMKEFVKELSQADVLLLLDIYSAGETPIEGVSGQILCDAISNSGYPKLHFVPTLDELPQTLTTVLKDGDVLLLQGAGSIGQMAAQLTQQSKK